jgi:hypothetical protein
MKARAYGTLPSRVNETAPAGVIHTARARRVLGPGNPKSSMPANREPLHEGSDRDTYYYRRSLSAGDFLMAAGVAIGVGVVAFYLTTRFAQRTPLVEAKRAGNLTGKRRVKGVAG